MTRSRQNTPEAFEDEALDLGAITTNESINEAELILEAPAEFLETRRTSRAVSPGARSWQLDRISPQAPSPLPPKSMYEPGPPAEVPALQQRMKPTETAEEKPPATPRLTVGRYLKRLTGKRPRGPIFKSSLKECFLSTLGAMLGIWAVAVIHYEAMLGTHATVKLGSQEPLSFILVSFGASAALVFGGPLLPVAQPYHVVGGNFVSSVIGVAFWYAFRYQRVQWIGCALSVASAIAAMQLCRCFHPPSAATALIGTLGLDGARELGFLWVLIPVTAGSCVLCVVGLLFNNMIKHRRPWPVYWSIF